MAGDLERKAWEQLGDWIKSLRMIKLESDGQSLLMELEGKKD